MPRRHRCREVGTSQSFPSTLPVEARESDPQEATDGLAGLRQVLEHGEVHEFDKLLGRQREESLSWSFKTNINGMKKLFSLC